MNTENMAPINVAELNESHLLHHPVWTWQEGSWDEPENRIRPVELTEDGLAGVSVLFIYSRFVTAGGFEMRGTIAYRMGQDEVYNIDLFCDSESIGFNKRLAAFALKAASRLKTALGVEDTKIFPVSYSVICPELNIPDGQFSVDGFEE